MNRRFASVLVFALIVAALASAIVYRLVVINVEAASRRPIPAHKMLVAARTLEVGTLIQTQDLKLVDTAELPATPSIADRKEAEGRGVIATIYAGEPISPLRLAPRGAGAGLAALIPIGKRAAALKVDEVVGVAGFVVPGMRVDVIVAGSNNRAVNSGTVSRTILQNIEVLSAGQKIEKTGDGKPQDAQVVNLLVTPDQAEVLSLASNEAKVQLVLRNPLDTQEEKTHGTSIAALFGADATPEMKTVVRAAAPRPAAPRLPAVETVEVFNGTKKTEQPIEVRQ